MAPTLIFVWLLHTIVTCSALTPQHMTDTTKLKVGESSNALSRLQVKLENALDRWNTTTHQQDELTAKIKTRLESLTKDIEGIKHNPPHVAIPSANDEKVTARYNNVKDMEAKVGGFPASGEDDLVKKQTKKGVIQMFRAPQPKSTVSLGSIPQSDDDIELRLDQLIDGAPIDPAFSWNSVPHNDDDIDDDSESPDAVPLSSRPRLNQIIKGAPVVPAFSWDAGDSVPHTDDDLEDDLESPGVMLLPERPRLNQIVRGSPGNPAISWDSIPHTDDDIEDDIESPEAVPLLDSKSINSQLFDHIPQNMSKNLAHSDEDVELVDT